MKINDDHLERLANYFIFFEIREKTGMTFEQFLDRWQRGVFDLW